MRELQKCAKIKVIRVLVSSFDKFRHFCTLHIFDYGFTAP